MIIALFLVRRVVEVSSLGKGHKTVASQLPHQASPTRIYGLGINS